MNNDRLQYLAQYYDNQKITVEIRPHRSTDAKGNVVIRRFTGKRAGIDFTNGLAVVDPAQLAELKKMYPEPGFLIVKEGQQ